MQTSKKIGAAIASVLFFLLTLALSVLLACSIAASATTSAHTVSAALKTADYSRLMGAQTPQRCLERYYSGIPAATEDYVQKSLRLSDTAAYLSNYAFAQENMLSGSAEAAALSAADAADILRHNAAMLEFQTGITLSERDYTALEQAVQPDIDRFNAGAEQAEQMLTSPALHLLLTRTGTFILLGALGGIFLLWFICAAAGHWRKSTMLRLFSTALCLPAVLVSAALLVLLLLVSGFHLIAPLQFIRDGLAEIILPVLLPLLCVALTGMILGTAGRFFSHLRKKAAPQPVPPVSGTDAPAPETVTPDEVIPPVMPAIPNETEEADLSDFTYAKM